MKITNLRTEYKTNPIGIDEHAPRLSWEMQTDERGWFQQAYQVKCFAENTSPNSDENLVWNSGKVISDNSNNINYQGPEPKKGQRVFWYVKVWDSKDNASPWSEMAFWQYGILEAGNWQAKWISPDLNEDISDSTPCPYLRKEVNLIKEVKSATAYVTAYGIYEFHLNGKKVSDQLFTPGWTSYHKRLQYQAYDVSDYLLHGNNAIGVILGDGWYRGYLVWQGNKNLYGDDLALLFQLEVCYTDGTTELITSDTDWKSNTGPILKSDIYNGETYDARLELNGWDLPEYKDATWKGSKLQRFSFTNIVASEGDIVAVTETLPAKEKIITPKGELVFDFGQNMVGWVQFTLKGKAGEKIVLHHAEVLDEEGNFYTDNLREAKAEDTYLFKGDGLETYEPRFTFHGFRYVRFSGYTGEINLEDVQGRVVHSAMKPIGEFECSDPLINQLQKNIQWGLRGNFLDVPTDCPQRDERLGWTGDAQVFAPTACFNNDTASFYRKWLKDLTVDQREDGSVPWVVPNVVEDGGGTGWSDGFGATGWSDAAVIIPWTVYKTYGDVRILEDQYTSMKAWTDYMVHVSPNYIFDAGFHFGDWLSFAEYYTYNYNAPDYGYAGAYTEKELIATAYFYYTTSLMVKIAQALNNPEDAEKYSALLPSIKRAFCDEFLTKTGRLTSNTQTAYILALSFGLLPDSMRDIGAKRLADDVSYFGHLTTGFLGTPLICQALTENGYPELAYQLLFNKRYPSWLYAVTQGATTIWERWDGIKPDGSFQTAGMNSFNHYSYGAVGDWLYASVAGLQQDNNSTGYKKSVIKPYYTNQLKYTRLHYQTVYGKIEIHWLIKNTQVELNVTIPPNTMSDVYFPCTPKEIKSGNEFTVAQSTIACTVLTIPSGSHKFVFPFVEVKNQYLN